MKPNQDIPLLGWRRICEIFGKGNFLHGKILLSLLAEGMQAAELKHPDYAQGDKEAMEVVYDEMREFIYAVEYETDERQASEARDVSIVAIRFLRGDHNAHR